MTTDTSTEPNFAPTWRHVGAFLGLTFGLTWLLDLAIYLRGGLRIPGIVAILQLQMLLPAFSAIVLGLFFFPESPIYRGRPAGRGRWFYYYFLLLTVIYAIGTLVIWLAPAQSTIAVLAAIPEILAFLGLLVLVVLRASAGRVERRGRVGFVAHASMLYDALTARENLRFFARLHGVDGRTRADDLLEQMGLAAWGDERVGAFSRGMTQRLAIARALLPDPDILLLDEPLTGLDDPSCAKVLLVLGELRARGRALLIASHQLAELLGVVTGIGFLVKGGLAALEPVSGRGVEAITARYREITAHG